MIASRNALAARVRAAEALIFFSLFARGDEYDAEADADADEDDLGKIGYSPSF